MLILVDQDGVLADFESAFHREWSCRGHTFPAIPLDKRRNFYVRDDYPTGMRQEVEAIYTAEGFYRSLEPIQGAINAMRQMKNLGHDVRICTSPLPEYKYCVPEKYEWIEKHLGPEYVSTIIVAGDKTLVRGDILIDDRPTISGALEPSWRHVIFDQPYNTEISGVRMTWQNWTSIISAGIDINFARREK